MIIDRVKVDTLDLHWGKQFTYGWHFNCFDVDGNPLPGLGGFVTGDVAKCRPEWQAGADKLIADIETLAQKWVMDYDEYESKSIVLAEVNVKRYHGGGQGIAFHYYRDDDPFSSWLLLTHRNVDEMARFNQKMDVREPSVTDALDADIEALLTQAEVLTLVMNQTRTLNRRYNHREE